MGEDWVIEKVTRDDSRLADWKTEAQIDHKNRIIIFTEGDESTEITRIMHEAMHRATGWGSDDELEEMKTEYATLCIMEFLRKRGVDLSPVRKL